MLRSKAQLLHTLSIIQVAYESHVPNTFNHNFGYDIVPSCTMGLHDGMADFCQALVEKAHRP